MLEKFGKIWLAVLKENKNKKAECIRMVSKSLDYYFLSSLILPDVVFFVYFLEFFGVFDL
jgi:hypothetical protein